MAQQITNPQNPSLEKIASVLHVTALSPVYNLYLRLQLNRNVTTQLMKQRTSPTQTTTITTLRAEN